MVLPCAGSRVRSPGCILSRPEVLACRPRSASRLIRHPARSHRVSSRCPLMACSDRQPDKDKPEVQARGPVSKALQRLSDAVDSSIQSAMQYIMPRERGDARDWALMWTSVAVLVYMTMHAYRLYAHLYYASGLRPIMHTLMR